MKRSVSTGMRRTRRIVALALAVAALPGLAVGFILYANWSAEQAAKSFCARAEVGSDIALATSRFQGGSERSAVLHQERQGVHDFIFRGFMFDKAYCSIAVAPDGKIKSRRAYMLYD